MSPSRRFSEITRPQDENTELPLPETKSTLSPSYKIHIPVVSASLRVVWPQLLRHRQLHYPLLSEDTFETEVKSE